MYVNLVVTLKCDDTERITHENENVNPIFIMFFFLFRAKFSWNNGSFFVRMKGEGVFSSSPNSF